jgi:CYTH domain-containing protein
MQELELEKTYLVKYLPEGLVVCEHKDLYDIYIPEGAEHPKLRIRRRGDKYEITKKTPLLTGDASTQTEQTVPLTPAEFEVFEKLPGKRVHKTRYLYNFEGQMAEVDVFEDDLKGLVLVDFEFGKAEEMKAFLMPEFCLAEVTQELFLAGGMLCGKKYSDIEGQLNKFGYKKIIDSKLLPRGL